MATTHTTSNKPTRISLFNLVVFLPVATRRNAVNDIVQNIIDRLPVRTIIIVVDENPLSVTTTPHLLEKGTSKLACEEIVIHTTTKELPQVSFALMPYLLPDLPVYLLWDQNPLIEKTVLPPLLPFATRLIFRADDTDNWQEFGKTMLHHLSHATVEMMDINWAMIGAWRDAFVRLFHTSVAIEQLRCCRQLSLSYSGKNGSDATQCLYLCSWLAAQLCWSLEHTRPSDSGELYVRYRHHHGTVDVILRPITDSSEPTGTLLTVELQTSDDLSYSLIRHPQGRTATVHISHRDSCEMPFALPLPTLKRSLNYMRELFHNVAGTHYRNMLHQLSALEN